MTRRTHIVGIFALAYLFFAMSALAWVIYEVSVSGQDLLDRVAAIADKNAKVKTYTEFSKLIEETEAERKTLASHVLTEDKTSAFLTEIESLASSVGVTLRTSSLEVNDKKESVFNSLIIKFEMEGPELFVKNLLSIFETLPYHSQVTSLTFTQTENGSVKGTVEIKVTLLDYEK